MANYLTQQDLDNYGSELIDVTQRAAMQTIAPYLQDLQNQNADLRARQAQEQRRRLDQEVAAAVPNYLEIDRDPEWHRWLMGIDLMSGRVRQALLNEAIQHGNAQRVALFFRQFQQQEGQGGNTGAPRRTRSATSKPIYTNETIAQLYSQHRRGLYAGREAEWDSIERDIFQAQAEGRVRATPFFSK
jgi:hypothetical protein